MTVDEQKALARRIADLLGRLHPEELPLTRLQPAHFLARRVAYNRLEDARGKATPNGDDLTSAILGPEYEI